MILRSLFLCGVLPLYAVLLALAVRSARRRRAYPPPAPASDVPFLWIYLRGCAGFPLLWFALLGLTWFFPGRLP
ncbi:hypothetical protein BX283_0130 [Streptomyces sp. TLI_146]|nr:hypothetical protein BX283_0130 [Streptomyces sp. TLI_146]